MLVFECNICRASLSATEKQAGLLVQCPTCHAKLRVPRPEMATAAATSVGSASAQSAAPNPSPTPAPPATRRPSASATTTAAMLPRVSPAARNPGKRYGFNCVYCSSRLEATEMMAAQEGQCPTCGNTIIIPVLDRYGRLIDPVTQKIIKQDPHPVHAYAAAGERAPKIIRESQNTLSIQCSRPGCGKKSPITANNCSGCGMPFTMEGTTVDAGGGANSFCIASLVLGIIAIPTGVILITPGLAIVFGIVGYRQVHNGGDTARGGGLAIAGISLGIAGLVTAYFFTHLM